MAHGFWQQSGLCTPMPFFSESEFGRCCEHFLEDLLGTKRAPGMARASAFTDAVEVQLE